MRVARRIPRKRCCAALGAAVYAVVVAAMVAGLVASPRSHVIAADAAAQRDDGAPARLVDSLFQRRDQVLWLGDETLESGSVARFVNVATLRTRPEDRLRFYSVGVRGSTAERAMEWAPRLVFMTGANVVFISYGRHDGGFRTAPDAGAADDYADALDRLVGALYARGVREVVVCSPVAFDEGDAGAHGLYRGCNEHLALLAAKSREVAAKRGAPFIDLFTHTREAFANAQRAGAPLTEDGVRPTEAGALIAASAALAGMGFGSESLSVLGWAPAPLDVFDASKPYLALPVAPDPAQASRTFEVAQAMRDHDLHFDVYWRGLDMGLSPMHKRRIEILTLHRAELDDDWAEVEAIVRRHAEQ